MKKCICCITLFFLFFVGSGFCSDDQKNSSVVNEKDLCYIVGFEFTPAGSYRLYFTRGSWNEVDRPEVDFVSKVVFDDVLDYLQKENPEDLIGVSFSLGDDFEKSFGMLAKK